MKITSTKNPHVKNVVKLRDAHHRRLQNRFIIEGLRSVGRAVTGAIQLEEVYVCGELLTDEGAEAVLERLRACGAAWYDVPVDVFTTIAYRRRPEGLLAVATRPTHALDDLPTVPNGLYIVAESLEKPGNLGAILRSLDAVGGAGLILCDKRTDVYNPNVITASTATVFSVPIAEADVGEAVAWLRQRQIALAATVCEGGRDYTEVDWTGPVALALGTEHEGLSDALQQAATMRVTIGMQGVADSLNVSAAATVLLFEAARQRRGG